MLRSQLPAPSPPLPRKRGREQAVLAAPPCLLARSTPRARAADGVLPARPFAMARRRIHGRGETALAFPHGGEAVEVWAEAGGEPREVGGAERGRLHHRRPVDRRVENV